MKYFAFNGRCVCLVLSLVIGERPKCYPLSVPFYQLFVHFWSCHLSLVKVIIGMYKWRHLYLFACSVDKPQLLPLSKSIELFPNMSHVFVCNTVSGSKPIFFEWTKDGHRIVHSDKSRVEIVDAMSMLTLRSLTRNDSGLFACKAQNTFGSDSTSTLLIVKGFYHLSFCY